MQSQMDDLRRLALRHARTGRTDTPVRGLTIYASPAPTPLLPGVYEPMLCLVLQGAKEVLVGDQVLRYDPSGYFIAALEFPASGRIVEASAAQPYVSLSFRICRNALAGLIADLPARPEPAGQPAGFAVSPLTPDLLDPVRRLVGLIEAPADAPILAPLLEREILYRLLQGAQGATLRQVACADSRLARVRRAIGWIRDHYDRPLRIDDLASLAGMSAASFHRHFRSATAMSPLQFQKTLRLHEARRLLLTHQDVSRAGYAVGYESASQFSREYARAFGAPPARDAVRLREGAQMADAAA